MKVKELIQRLQQLDQEREVKIIGQEANIISTDISDVFESDDDKSAVQFVCIEAYI